MAVMTVLAVSLAGSAFAADAAKGKEVFDAAKPACKMCHTDAKHPLQGGGREEAGRTQGLGAHAQGHAHQGGKTGTMPTYGADKISDADLDNLVAYIALAEVAEPGDAERRLSAAARRPRSGAARSAGRASSKRRMRADAVAQRRRQPDEAPADLLAALAPGRDAACRPRAPPDQPHRPPRPAAAAREPHHEPVARSSPPAAVGRRARAARRPGSRSAASPKPAQQRLRVGAQGERHPRLAARPVVSRRSSAIASRSRRRCGPGSKS